MLVVVAAFFLPFRIVASRISRVIVGKMKKQRQTRTSVSARCTAFLWTPSLFPMKMTFCTTFFKSSGQVGCEPRLKRTTSDHNPWRFSLSCHLQNIVKSFQRDESLNKHFLIRFWKSPLDWMQLRQLLSFPCASATSVCGQRKKKYVRQGFVENYTFLVINDEENDKRIC